MMRWLSLTQRLAEIKAEDAAQQPKRRSIFRTTGTASTPDLTTFIRGKGKPQQGKQAQKNSSAGNVSQHAMGQGKSSTPASSTTAVSSQFTTHHMSGSTSSLTRGRSHEAPSDSSAQRGAWHGHNFPNDSQRHMQTIAENDSLHRKQSFNDDGKVSNLQNTLTPSAKAKACLVACLARQTIKTETLHPTSTRPRS